MLSPIVLKQLKAIKKTLRLINPAKNELGRISKTILDNINMKLFETTKINQWKNMVSAIKWFNLLKDKHLMKFVMFDIKDFYPSIMQDLLNKALNFTSEYIYISKSDIDVIHHARESLLFDGSHTWIKKQGGLFDVSMGAYNGGEVCELVGTYMLNLLSKKYNKKDFGLYRDDGLAVLKNKSGPQQWRIQRLIWAHCKREARAWENQLGVCKPPSGYRAEPCWWKGAKPPENFDDLLVKITFLKLNMPFYET